MKEAITMAHREKQTNFRFRLAKEEARIKKTTELSKRKSNVIPLRPSSHISEPIQTAFDTCQEHRKLYEEVDGDRDAKLHLLLAQVLKFYQIGHTDQSCEEAYRKVLDYAGVRITGNTKNAFTPAVKAVFGDTERSNVSRYASVLFAANNEGIMPENVGAYVEKSGGIVKTARKGSELLNPNRGATLLERNEKRLKDLDTTARPLKAQQLSNDLPIGLSSALVRKHANGSLTLLSFLEEEPSVVTRYKPLK